MKKVVAKALITDNSGNLLMLFRGMTHPNFPGHLDLPGGEVEENEEWNKAVAREVMEETALQIDSSSLKKSLEKSYPNVTHVLYTTTLTDTSPKPSLSWEHSGYKWYTKNDLLKKSLPKGVDSYYLDVVEYLNSTK
jgi:8-oxo-dGTP pyrophosphatase MutT (NUDIX family)